MVNLINEILGKDIKAKYINTRPGDIKHSLADISKARTFGYNPEGTFRNELAEVVRWFANESSRKNRK